MEKIGRENNLYVFELNAGQIRRYIISQLYMNQPSILNCYAKNFRFNSDSILYNQYNKYIQWIFNSQVFLIKIS